MGFFDSLGSLFDAATPWVTVEAEALTHGDTSTDKTPADSDNGGEGESMDPSGATVDGISEVEKAGDDDESSAEQAEEPEEEELTDPKEAFEAECRESKQCSAPKHHFDECVELVTSGHNKKYPNEDCVEEFFHLTHCAGQCAAPKLWSVLK